MSLKTLQIAFRMVSKKLFFTPKPPSPSRRAVGKPMAADGSRFGGARQGGLKCNCGLWIADLKNFLKKILNMESSAYGI
jgi:hypothetical protein